MDLVSIIVPIYNSEKYLSECIDSILKQSYQNFELLLIDDGSTDSSEEICRRYLDDSRIKYYKKENSGVSDTRNFGIEKSSGKYISFIDSDDYVDSDFLKIMVEGINKKSDLSVVGYRDTYLNRKFDCCTVEKKITDKKKIESLIFDEVNVQGFCCNKLFVASIIKNNKIKFDTELRFLEDLFFCMNYSKYVTSVSLNSGSLYNYRMRKSSASHNCTEKDKIATFLIFEKLDNEFEISENINYQYFKLIHLIKIKKFIKKEEKYKINKIYSKIMKSDEITKIKKLKLFIYRYFLFVFDCYMKIKSKRNGLFD